MNYFMNFLWGNMMLIFQGEKEQNNMKYKKVRIKEKIKLS